jgi:hypothetical protein
MDENWVQFDSLEFIDKRLWPRVPLRRFFEINPLGEVRYLKTNGPTPRYKLLKPAVYDGKAYFMAPVGMHQGHVIISRILLSDLVKRFFKS